MNEVHVKEPRDVLMSRRGMLGSLAALGLAGGLAACGGSDGGSSGETVVTAWNEHPENKALLEKLMDKFHETHEDVVVEMSVKPADKYDALLKTALVGGAAPDALGFLGAAALQAGVSYLTPIDGKVDVADLTPIAREAVTYQGHTWGVPLVEFSVGVFYQRPVFEEHGLQPPRTWGELKDVCQTLQDKGVVPLSMPGQDMILPLATYNLAVNSILGLEGEAELAAGRRKLTDRDLLPAAELLAELNPYYNKGFAAVPYAEGKALFAQGRTAMIIGGSEDFAGYLEVNPEVDVGVFGFPSPSGDKHVTTSATDIIYGVNKKSPHKAAVVKFLAWLAGAEAQQMVADTLGLPVRKGITARGGGDKARVRQEMLEAGAPSTTFWATSPVFGGTYPVALKNAGVLSGDVSPSQFAAALQGGIKPAG